MTGGREDVRATHDSLLPESVFQNKLVSKIAWPNPKQRRGFLVSLLSKIGHDIYNQSDN